jgi:hypothetical protein
MVEQQERVRKEKLINDLKHEKALLRASAPPYPKVIGIIGRVSALFLLFSL